MPSVIPIDRPSSETATQDATGANATKENSAGPQNTTTDLTATVDVLLANLRARYNAVSQEMSAKMDDMSRRLDELEDGLRKRDGS